MKVIVCGWRDFRDVDFIYAQLDILHAISPIDVLIHGGAKGVDSIAGGWAMRHGVKVVVYPANWNLHGKAAGPKRNAEMLNENPDAVIAFPGGRGTSDMKRQAKAAGVRVIEVKAGG